MGSLSYALISRRGIAVDKPLLFRWASLFLRPRAAVKFSTGLKAYEWLARFRPLYTIYGFSLLPVSNFINTVRASGHRHPHPGISATRYLSAQSPVQRHELYRDTLTASRPGSEHDRPR